MSGFDWRWREAPIAQPGSALGSRHPGLILDFAVPELAAAELERTARALERGLELPCGRLHDAGDASTLALRALEQLGTRAGLPIAEPIRQLHRGPGWLVVRVPVLPSMTSAMWRACDALLQTLADPACEPASASARWADVLERLRASRPRTSNTFRFMRAAEALSLPVLELSPQGVQYGQGRRSRWLDSSFTESTSVIAANIARDKTAGAKLLRRAGLPVPVQHPVRDDEAAVGAARRLGYPVVVKPADLDGGIGVSVGLRDGDAVVAAFHRARAHSKKILVEQFVPGRDYRLIVHGGELIWAIERVVAGVTGDGRTSVARLLDALNADPRRSGPHAVLKQVRLDEESLDLLGDAGLAPESIPAMGRFVRLRRAANVATGGMPVAALQQVHPDNALLAIRAAAALRLDLAGVDLLIPDIGRSWLDTGAGICEVNAQPNLGALTSAHIYAQLLRRIVPASGRIPVVVVLGAPRDGKTVADLEFAVAARGFRVGATDARGMRLAGAVIHRGPVPAFAGLQALLQDVAIEVAIISVTDASILASGLPCPAIDLLVLAGDDVYPTPGEDAAATRVRLEAALRMQCDGEVITLASDASANALERVADAVVRIDGRHAAQPDTGSVPSTHPLALPV